MNKYFFFFLFLIAGFFSNIVSFTWPLEGTYPSDLNSTFGSRYLSTGPYPYDWHNGIDISCQSSSEVLSAHGGFCEWAAPIGNYGKTMIMTDELSGYLTLYAHLTDYIIAPPQPGQPPLWWTEGYNIATCVYSIVNNITHLHFEYATHVSGGNIPPEHEQKKHPMEYFQYNNDDPDLDDPLLGTDEIGKYIDVVTRINEEELDLNEVKLFITGEDQYGTPYDENILLRGATLPKNRVNFNTRLNCSTAKYQPTVPMVNDGIKIIPQHFDGWNDQILTFRFYVWNDTWQWLIEADAYAIVIDVSGSQKSSNTVKIISGFDPPTGAPDPPTGLVASSNYNDMTVDLTWDVHPMPSVQYYVIYRRPDYTTDPEEASVIGISYQNSFKDKYETSPGQGYYYSIAAINEIGEGANSIEVLCTMPSYGTVTSNRVWKDECNITNNVTINSGIELTLLPNTILKFNSGKELRVYGKLRSQGTATDSITFTSTYPNPTVGQYWNWIKFYSSSDDNSVIEFTRIEFGNYGINCESANPIIRHNTFYKNQLGIYLVNTGNINPISDNLFLDNTNRGIQLINADVTIANNQFTNNSFSGIFCYDHSDPYIYRNTIESSDNSGIYCMYYSSPLLAENHYNWPGYNIVKENAMGVFCNKYSSPLMGISGLGSGYNSIYANTVYDAKAIYDSHPVAENNWWGEYPPDPSDFYKDGNSTIDYSPALNYDPNSEAIYTQYVSINTEDTTFWSGNLRNALFFQLNQNYQRAIALYAELIQREKITPRAKYALVGLAESYEKSGQSNFLLYLNNVLRPIFPLNSEIYGISNELEARFLRNEGRFLDAIIALDRVINSFSGIENMVKYALFNKGIIYLFDLGDWSKAKLAFDDLINRYPNDPLVFDCRLLLQGSPGEELLFQDKQNILNSTLISDKFELHQNYPNPFNPLTTIAFDLPKDVPVLLEIFDITGRKICTLVNEQKEAGTHQVIWDGQDDHGNSVASGVYVNRIQVGDFVQSKKLLFMK